MRLCHRADEPDVATPAPAGVGFGPRSRLVRTCVPAGCFSGPRRRRSISAIITSGGHVRAVFVPRTRRKSRVVRLVRRCRRRSCERHTSPCGSRTGRALRVEESRHESASKGAIEPRLEPSRAPAVIDARVRALEGARRHHADRRPTCQSPTPRRSDDDRWAMGAFRRRHSPACRIAPTRRTSGPLAVMRFRTGHTRECRRHFSPPRA